MSSVSERSRNNVAAGIFVLVALLLAVAAVVALTDIGATLFENNRSYIVTFDVGEGVKNIKGGAAVRVGGVQMGKVTRIEPVYTDGPLERIDVHFEIDERVPLYDDATVVITPAIIGGDAWIEVTDVGDPSPGEDAATHIDGYSGPGVLTALMGVQNAERADRLMVDAGETVENFKATSADVRALAARIRHDDWEQWASDIDVVMSWASGATEQFDAILDEGYGLVSETREIVSGNRDDFETTIDNVTATSDNVAAITQRVRNVTLDKVDNLLGSGQKGMDRAVELLEALHQEFDTWSPEVADALVAFRQTGQQLKLFAAEVRRSPWKILYRPRDEELSNELLYEAARSFAMAAADLKAAADSTERILVHHADEIRLDPAKQESIRAHLEDSMQRYRAAEQDLVNVLKMD